MFGFLIYGDGDKAIFDKQEIKRARERFNRMMFTEQEKNIARCFDKKYKWIARDKSGKLFIYTDRPWKVFSEEWATNQGRIMRATFDNLFQPIQWIDDAPTMIRTIYDPIFNDKNDD